MTVYRPKQGEKAVHTRCAVQSNCCLSDMVPVERCKHGNIDGHWTIQAIDYTDRRWCHGAGIGDKHE